MREWNFDGHLVKLTASDEILHVEIVCPGKDNGCTAHVRCEYCGGNGDAWEGPFNDGGEEYRRERCKECGGTGNESGVCLLLNWADGLSADELHDGFCRLDEVSFPHPIRWRLVDSEEGPEWRFVGGFYSDEEDAKEVTVLCGAVEPNQTSANAAICDLDAGHVSPYHEGFAHGPAADERPGRYRWRRASG